jgi:hypothetical protein
VVGRKHRLKGIVEFANSVPQADSPATVPLKEALMLKGV